MVPEHAQTFAGPGWPAPTPAAPRSTPRSTPPSTPRTPSRAVRLWWLIPGAILAVLSLWWGTYNVLMLLAHEEYSVRYEFDADEIVSIDVGTVEGSITVTGDASDTVVVVAEVSDGWRPTGLQVAVVDGVLRARGTCPVIGSQWCDADFEVSVPPDMVVRVNGADGNVRARGLTSGVDIDTDDGRVELSEIGGTIHATNDNGSIIGTRLTATSVDASTRHGRVELSFLQPPDDVRGRSSNGSIEVAVPDDDVTYRVDLDTDHGSTDILVRTDPNSDHTVDLATHNGSLTVRPPD